MKRRTTRSEARAFRKRWQAVNTAEQEELRAASFQLKFEQFAALMASAEGMGWGEKLAEGEEEVRQRWCRLRSLHGV
jgi:hypothetical protein